MSEICTDFSMIIRQSIATRLLRAVFWLCHYTSDAIAWKTEHVSNACD